MNNELDKRYEQAEALEKMMRDLDNDFEALEVTACYSVTNDCYTGCLIEIAQGYIYDTARQIIEFRGGYTLCSDHRGWHEQYKEFMEA
jgi:hypothetical protein